MWKSKKRYLYATYTVMHACMAGRGLTGSLGGGGGSGAYWGVGVGSVSGQKVSGDLQHKYESKSKLLMT